MTGDLTPRPDDLAPQQRDVRMSDADRERVVERLQSAVGEGRLTLDEFQERVDGVLRAKTFGEVDVYLADLPAVPVGLPVTPRDVMQIRAHASSIRRRGRWSVPRKLVVQGRAGSVKLDFTEAVVAYPVVEIQLEVSAGSTTLVLPHGATANADEVELYAGSVKVRGVDAEPRLGSGPHFVVAGVQRAGSLVIRHKRHFLRWSW